MEKVINLIKVILIIIAVSIDCFVTSLGIGSMGIKIPFGSALLISFTGTVFLSGASAFADAVNGVIPQEVSCAAASVILVYLGLRSLFKNFFGRREKKGGCGEKLTAAELVIINAEHTRTIPLKESLTLAVALSADSLITGLSAGLSRMNIPALCIGSLTAGLLAIFSGERLGRKIVSASDINLNWLCGTVLLILALVVQL